MTRKNQQQRCNRPDVLLTVLTIGKYAFSIAFTVFAFSRSGIKKYLVIQLLELFAVIFLSDALLRMNRHLGRICSGLLMLLYNTQILVLYFGNTYLSLIMLNNLDSVEDLQGKAVIYILGIVLVLVFSFLPIAPLHGISVWSAHFTALFLAVELFATCLWGNIYSPFFAYYAAGSQAVSTMRMAKQADAVDEISTNFFLGFVPDYYKKPKDLPDNPNIILIFAEGLSQHIVEDPRHIMDNVHAYEKKSLNFTHYYNHTFATYRGLIGQLYSGYQLNNYDVNSLVSIQSVLSGRGYHTSFINAEPNNLSFASYLDKLGFDEIIGEKGAHYNGQNKDIMSDRETFELLLDTALKEHEKGTPFLTAVYTFGTHASFDSQDEVFGDGSNAELNKFYNLDFQFGAFMEQFEQSALSEDTIVVFTADHATYADAYYSEAFPDYVRDNVEIDTMPLFIYYSGMKRKKRDVNGRNSLDLVPTVLDYLDISEPNYFLGVSLFAEQDNGNNYETIFDDSFMTRSTYNCQIRELSENEKELFDMRLVDYYALKQ